MNIGVTLKVNIRAVRKAMFLSIEVDDRALLNIKKLCIYALPKEEIEL